MVIIDFISFYRSTGRYVAWRSITEMDDLYNQLYSIQLIKLT